MCVEHTTGELSVLCVYDMCAVFDTFSYHVHVAFLCHQTFQYVCFEFVFAMCAVCATCTYHVYWCAVCAT